MSVLFLGWEKVKQVSTTGFCGRKGAYRCHVLKSSRACQFAWILCVKKIGLNGEAKISQFCGWVVLGFGTLITQEDYFRLVEPFGNKAYIQGPTIAWLDVAMHNLKVPRGNTQVSLFGVVRSLGHCRAGFNKAVEDFPQEGFREVSPTPCELGFFCLHQLDGLQT